MWSRKIDSNWFILELGSEKPMGNPLGFWTETCTYLQRFTCNLMQIIYLDIYTGWILACVRFCPHLFKVRSTQLVVEKVLWSSVRINCFLSFWFHTLLTLLSNHCQLFPLSFLRGFHKLTMMTFQDFLSQCLLLICVSKTVAVLALLLSYLSASQLVGEPRRGFRGFAEHCDAAAVRVIVIVILRCPCFSFLELGWGHDDDDKDFFHHPSFGLVEEISMYCHCQTSVCQDLWSLSISVRWLDCDPLLSLLKLTSWLTLLLVCVLSLFVSMAAASSSAANTTVDMTAVDEEIEWHSEFEGHGESSDPDFDPADRAENLLGSLHDRMIISMSPIPRLEVFLGWCWLYSVQVRNLSQSLHLFALLASLSRLEHECLGLSRFYGLPPVSEMRLVLHCCKNWFVVQWTCLSTNHHKLWNGRKDNGKVHVWKFGDKHWVRNPQLRLPITVQLYHCPSVSLSHLSS